MRILFLSAWCPLPADNGSKLRIVNILRELARWHEVDLLAFAPEQPDAEAMRALRSICAHVELLPETAFGDHAVGRFVGLFSSKPRSVVANHSTRMIAAVQHRERQRYDLVIASQLHMAPYALLIPGVPRLIDEVELAVLKDQYLTARHRRTRLRYGMTWWKTSRYIAGLLRQFDGATVVSERELGLVRMLAPPRIQIMVVPNGVDVLANQGNYGPPDADTLIYPGAISYAANFDAVAYFAEVILPSIRSIRPSTRLRVTGHATPAQIAALPRGEGLEFTGFLKDVRPAVAQAWAEVVPLRKGGGTRLKILEALALGTPVVSTAKGIEGLVLKPDRHVLVADTPAEFAAATTRLLGDAHLRARLAAEGRQAVRERYDWQIIGQLLNDCISEMTAGSREVSRPNTQRI